MASSASVYSQDSLPDDKPGDLLPMSIPTKTDSLFSGFPYQQGLFDLDISPRQWEQFNGDIQAALNPSAMDRLAMKTKNMPLLPIGPIYMAAYGIVQASNRSLDKKVIRSMQDDVGQNAGNTLAAVLERWNTQTFGRVGLEVTVQLARSAAKRTQKEEKRRKEQERKIREKYGTTHFYDDDDQSSSAAMSNDKRYRILIQRAANAADPPPQYLQNQAPPPIPSKAPFHADVVPMLDSTPTHRAAELYTAANVAELPAHMADPKDQSSRKEKNTDCGLRMPMHTEGGFLPVELPDTSIQR